MTQNVYDHEKFFDGYAQLPRSVKGLDAAPEWPALRAMLPKSLGRVVDLGCGYGWFARWACANGARSVLGIDVSEKMLARARARATSSNAPITYFREDLEILALPIESFESAYSSLALHYVADLYHLISVVSRALVPGGTFVFSVEHPLLTAPRASTWLTDSAGRQVWPTEGYLDEGPRSRYWIAEDVIKQHRTIATYLNSLLRHGFAITQVEEWGPSPDDLAAHPEWALDHQRPPFLLVAARRETSSRERISAESARPSGKRNP